MTALTVTALLLAGCYLVRDADARTLNERITWLQQRLHHHQGFVRFIQNHHLLERNGCGQAPAGISHPPNEQVCRRLERIWRYEQAAVGWTRRELTEAAAELRRRDWDWRAWLPAKWARIGACETGYGHQPGNWHWDSGRYVSAFGIYRPAYAQFAHAIGQRSWDEPGVRTPREQYLVALAIYHRYGLSGWGCRNA